MLSAMGSGMVSVIELAQAMILNLHWQRLSVSAISRACGIDCKTIRNYIERGMEASAYTPFAHKPYLQNGSTAFSLGCGRQVILG